MPQLRQQHGLQLNNKSETDHTLQQKNGTAGSAVPFHFQKRDQAHDDFGQCVRIVGCNLVCTENDFSVAIFNEFCIVDFDDGGLLDLASSIDLQEKQNLQG